jgi:hypothetical protein
MRRCRTVAVPVPGGVAVSMDLAMDLGMAMMRIGWNHLAMLYYNITPVQRPTMVRNGIIKLAEIVPSA